MPVTVWRFTGADLPHSDLAPRIAQLLVGLYTRDGDTIISVGDDPALAGAAGAAARHHLSVDSARRLTDRSHLLRAAQLVVLRWPLAGDPNQSGEPATARLRRDRTTMALAACRNLLTADGYTAVQAPPTAAVAPQQLLVSARKAGLICSQHVVAMSYGDRSRPLAASADRPGQAQTTSIALNLFMLRARSTR